MKAKIMHCKEFILENEIKRVNEELEKPKRTLKMERKSSIGIRRSGRKLKYLGYGIMIGFFARCITMNLMSSMCLSLGNMSFGKKDT